VGRRLVLAAVAAVALTAPPALADFGAAVPPELTVKLSPARFRVGSDTTPLTESARRAPVGTKFTWQASEPVEVGIRVEQRVPPRRKGGKATFKRVALLIRNVPAGDGSLDFSGRIEGKGALKPGAYRAIARASDQFDNKSEATTLPFSIVAR
jgi:hypothetical protein